MEWLKEFAKDDFGKTVLTVFGTLVVTAFGAFLGGVKDIALDWWKRRGFAKYNAMIIATKLDQFIADCVDLTDDPKFTDEQGIVQGTVPNPTLEWPKEIDWPSLPSELMYRCLLLPERARSATEAANFIAANVSGPPDYTEFFEELELRFSEVGLHAVHILQRLKESYGVQSQDRYEKDPKKIFLQTINKVRASKERQSEQQAAMIARMEENQKKRAQAAKEIFGV